MNDAELRIIPSRQSAAVVVSSVNEAVVDNAARQAPHHTTPQHMGKITEIKGRC